MPENMSAAVHEISITRRAFLKGSVGLGLMVLAAQGAGLAAAVGCRREAPSADITVTSSLDLNHSHKVTIPGADIDSAPSEKTYTSDGPTHTHAMTLAKADFTAIKSGQTVTKTSTQTGATPHTHTLAIKKA